METTMKDCISCHARISAKAKFCNSCGEKVKSTPEAELTIKCPGRDEPCGNKLTVKDCFCTECGFKVDHSLFKVSDPVQIPIDKAVASKEHGQDHADTKTEIMIETAGSTTDSTSGSVLAEDNSKSDIQPDSPSSEKTRKNPLEISASGIRYEGNKPKMKNQENNSSKGDKESENVAKQATGAPGDTADDVQVSAHGKEQSHESSIDQQTPRCASGQDTSNQPCKETNEQAKVCDQTASQDPTREQHGIEKPDSDADRENIQTAQKEHTVPSQVSNDAKKSQVLAEDNSKSDIQSDSSSSEKTRKNPPELSASGIRYEGNKPKMKNQENNSSKCDKESENVAKQATGASGDTADDVQVSAHSKEQSHESSIDQQTPRCASGQDTSNQPCKETNEQAKVCDQAISQDPTTEQHGIEKPDSDVSDDNKISSKMLQKSNSTQSASGDIIFYPPNINGNNSNDAGGIALLDCKPDGPNYERVFGNGTSDPMSMGENEPNPSKNDAEKHEKKLNYPNYPEFKSKNKNKGKNKNKSSEKKNVSQHEHSGSAQNEENKHVQTRSFVNEVEVMFHVIISEDSNHDSNNEDLYMAFGPDILGNWKTEMWKMTRKCKKEDYYEYSLSVKMSKSLRDRGFQYKYVFMGKNCTEFESVHFMQVRTKKNDPNREFHLPHSSEKTSLEVWHQYDGFAYRKVSDPWYVKAATAVKELFYKDMKEKAKSDTKKAAEHFLPSADEIIQSLKNEDTPVLAEEFLRTIFTVMACLRIQIIDQRLGFCDEEFFQECFDPILVPLFDELSICVKNAEKKRTSDHALSLAVFMLMMMNDNRLEMRNFNKMMGTFFKSLLLQADWEKRSCPNYELMKKKFPKRNELILRTLKEIIKEHTNNVTSDSSWLYCLPLIHFLHGESEPFKISESGRHRTDKWWGLIGLEDVKNKMKKQSEGYVLTDNTSYIMTRTCYIHAIEWNIPVQHVIEDLHPLFEVDYLLPRSIMAVVTTGQLENAISPGKIPPFVVTACLFYHSEIFKRMNMDKQTEDLLAKLFKDNAEQFKTRNETELSSAISDWKLKLIKAELHISKTIVKDLVETNLGYGSKSNLVVATMSVCLAVVSGLDAVHQLQDKAEDSNTAEETEAWKLLQTLENHIVKWLREKHHFMYTNTCLQNMKVWNSMINLEMPASELKQNWQKTLLQAFETEISSLSPWICDQVLMIGANSDFLSDGLKESLTSAAFHSFEKEIMKNPHKEIPLTKTFGKMLSKILEKQWPSNGTDDEMLHFVTTFKPMTQYFERFYKEENLLLTDTCIDLLIKASSVLTLIIDTVCKGNICVRNLRKVLLKKENVIRLVEAAEANFSEGKADKTDLDHLKRVLEAREKELEYCDQYLLKADELMCFCGQLQKVNTAEMSRDIHETRDTMGQKMLEDICIPAQIKGQDQFDVTNYKPSVNIFSIPHELLFVFSLLKKRMQSVLFQKIWIQEGANDNLDNSLDSVVAVWRNAEQKWNELCMSIRNGTISFQAIKEHTYVFNGDYEKIKQEFTLMNPIDETNQWVEERIEQLKTFSLVDKCQRAAREIMQIQDVFAFTGNFAPVIEILNLTQSTSIAMKKMDQSVLKTCSFLEDVTPKQIESLVAFRDSKPLVDWLRTSMKDGLKELKVFVDLAYISAGEGDHEIHKVNCLHAATNGYAPLVFDCNQQCDYHMFLDSCRSVWRELKTNPKLPEMLRDTGRYLEWLKEVSQSHGSVEVTSLSQAGMINSTGVYRIGNLMRETALPQLDLNHVISLHVMPDNCTNVVDCVRKYSHNQLVDLQSRLMLVAGRAEKGKENVDQFMMILDGIVRLSKTYIRLVSDGCVLFNSWRANFLCDQGREACAILDFGENSESLKGYRRSNRLEEFINALANIFENCHMDWLKYVSDKRDQYLELNFYTITQLVFLQKELIKIGTEVEPSNLIFPLLSLIKPDCSMADIQQAMQKAKDEVFHIEMTADELEDTTIENQDADQSFIQEVMKSGFSEILAQAALKHVDDADIDAGIVWCLEHEEDAEFLSSAVDQVEMTSNSVEEQFSGWTSDESSFASRAASLIHSLPEQLRKDTSVKALSRNIKQIWQTFLASVSSSVADYLSVEHLGIILHKLALSWDQTLNRELPVQLKAKSPNLMVCQKSDVLNAVLHIYMHDTIQPLPRPDEVLLCTPETTFIDVDIFLRRAFFSCLGKIHCLAYADLLRYEIEEKIEKKFIEYIAKANVENSDYKLVVLCSSENEFRARIVAALERHRCQPPIIKVQNIKDYLTQKFTGVHVKKNKKSASNVDFSQSTVRVVKSKRAGVGKTLYKKRRVGELRKLNHGSSTGDLSVSISLYEKNVVMTQVADKLLPCTLKPEQVFPRIFHLNISYEVQEGLDYLLFNLLILGKVTNEKGHIWLRSVMDLYLVEIIPLSDLRDQRRTNAQLIHPIFEVLPHVTCWSPQDSLQILTNTSRPDDYESHDLLFDQEEFCSVVYQRPFQYLSRWESKASLSDIAPSRPQGDPAQCLVTLLRHCGVHDPSWAELHHFVWFLNTQLCDFERSVFCSTDLQDDLPGFSLFVLRFLIQMSRDFATRSLNMSEETPIGNTEPMEPDEDVISHFQMRRTWERSPHPYIFFNPDGQTMTFLGFNINRQTGDLIDQQTGAVLEKAIMPKNLQDSLIRNRVPLNENFDQLERLQRLEKLCSVMPGVEYFYDPDITYELTTDNVKKILAIYMRFRCNIPVLIMGETGCGKTRLVKFLCSLQCPPGTEVENMVIMKVHGGTTADDIIKKVHKAEQLAQANARINEHMYTVLFFDEANTTEAIGLIKEIMCDGTMDGQPLQLSEKLKIVAACNPYRKHSDELIDRLEKAGLGYHVDAEKTTDKLGRVPMRRLVYRVQPLPQSMLPLVWDFGQLNARVEELYIRQMVNHYVCDDMLPPIPRLVEVVSTILIQSQNFMRNQKDECSFVSLRDVERVLKVMTWFYQQSQENRTLFHMMEQEEASQQDEDEDNVEEEDEDIEENSIPKWPDDLTKSLILALGVCYRASLRSRDAYDEFITGFFQIPCNVPGGEAQFVDIIIRCQDVFLENVQLEENIARNQALKENLFMMIICIELRIPLFLVGKPGSSKSLAKTIVSDAMQGNSARKELFKELKQAQMVSFQCSPLSVAEGILGTFRQCAQFQKDKDLDRFVSIVVLDEVGLAEDSVRMPLKTLHPLLEDGCQGDEAPEPYKKVAFIGISNWALDPAKMNRGILVQREVPDQEELIESAKGICASNEEVLQRIKSLLPQLAEAYKAVFDQTLDKREFFGLRDFYSLVKMIYGFAARQHRLLCWHQLEHTILRNFGGLDTGDPVKVFREKITGVVKQEKLHEDDPINTTAGLIEAALFGDLANRSNDNAQTEGSNPESATESRYLLLLTENYGALRILQQILDKHRVITIFGSSFPKDQEYTQVCRNINRIKVCMETGNTVILLNLENLYESLYDALNQYYARLGGERFVDLGLGTHRVKCRVHQDFRLIVVAEKQIVYEKFPIPLINRLEKHFLTLKNMMNEEQSRFAEDLHHWANRFVKQYQTGFNTEKSVSVADAFMGYHPDTTAAIVLHMWAEKDGNVDDNDDFLEDCQKMLLWCATPDSVLRLKETQLHIEEQRIFNIYFKEQPHDDIFKYMIYRLELHRTHGLFAQVTTHSKLLTDPEKEHIMTALGMEKNNIILLTLQSFDTEQQFCQQIRNFVDESGNGLKLLLIQCGSGDKNMSLIKSAQYCVEDELPHDDKQFAVFFIVQLPRVAGGCFTGFMAGKWHSLHIDELRPEGKLPSVHQLHNNTPANVLQGRASQELTNRVTNADTQIESLNLDSSHSADLNVSTEIKHVEQQQEEMDFTEGDENFDNAVVAVENIMLEEVHSEVTPMDTEQSDTELPAYFQDLILRCIQSAAALVRDDEHDSRRSTKRIEILLHFLENQNSESEELSFLVGLSKMLIRLLHEKEVDVSGHTAANWLSKEAAKPDNVKKAGTFRRSWLQCLESKIVTILAGVIAFLDMNQNLDIVRNRTSEHWAHILWLRILHSPSACELHYQNLLSPMTQQELGEIIPYNTGVHGKPFSAELPFSWLLQQLIESGLSNFEHTHHEESEDVDEAHTMLKFVAHFILNTPYGIILNAVSTERGSNQREMIMCYIKDFVHTKYPCSSGFKHQILYEGLEISSKPANMDFTVLDLMPALVAVHHIHSLVMGRLQAFLDIEQVWPEVLDAVYKMREKDAHPLLRTEELTLDILGLILLLEQLEPQKDQLNNEKGRADWLEKVKTFSPLIQRILDNTDNMAVGFGQVCLEHMERARCLWTRVITIKLFLESFSPKGSKNKKLTENLVERYMPLWQLLGEHADLKKIKSLSNVERFLKSVNKNVLQKLSEKQGSCSNCSSAFETPPVVLPCRDKICQKCYNDLLVLDDPYCPKCHRVIPKDFNKHPGSEQKDFSDGYQVYQRCCNTFLMAVVSNLCFGGDTAPENAVIERILSYITRRTSSPELHGVERLQTKQMTVFDDLVDPTPVVRSFLLQLLIHKSCDHVQRHLDDFLKRAHVLCEQQSQHNSSILPFGVMVIQCLEDQLHEHVTVDDAENEMKMALRSLSTACEWIDNPIIDMNKMHAIANARFGLMTVAKYLYRLVIEKSITKSASFTKMIRQAKKLFEIENFDWPKNFFLKQLCKEFGTDSYHRICQWGEIAWVAIEEQTDKVKECADRYVVCSLDYQKIRDSVAKTLLGDDVTHLKTLLDEIPNPLKKMYLLLAIHREVTLKHVQPNVRRDEALAKAVGNLKTFADNSSLNCVDLLHQLLQNHFGQQTAVLNFQPDQSLRDQSILCLLFHFSLVLRNCQGKENLLHPLIALATNPALFTNTLLPTMPQDDLAQITQILKMKGTVVMYRCPNGHAYAITECGRPYTEGRCNECGAKIGGASHNAFEGNVQDSGIDQTKTGHILGDASQRPNDSMPERQLTGQACALLRLLTHAALLLGCDINQQAIASMVQPGVQNVSLFFLNHIQKDIEQLHRGVGKSVDDIFLMIHFLFHQISDETPGIVQPTVQMTLANKIEREAWEEKFASTFIYPVLQDLDSLLQTLNNKIMEDERFGQNKLRNILYEVDTTHGSEVMDNLHNIPDVWRYRSRITLDHFMRVFHLQIENTKTKQSHLVLRLFRSESYYLQAMRYIPSILTLQRHLMLRFRRRLNRAEANKMTIKDVLRTENHGFDIQKLFEDFAAAWECVKEKLLDYGCWSLHGGLIRLPEEYRNVQITPNSKLAVLLPSTTGPGLCSYILLEFLLKKHNYFMDSYCTIIKQNYNGLPEVSVKDLKANHLICYHPDKDLLPLVLANCNYSFKLGEGTKVEYDFDGFEHQLKEMVLQAKSRVHQQNSIIHLETMLYRADTANAIVFKTLRDKVKQEALSPAVRLQVSAELHANLPDICDSIDNLDIAVCFLKSLGDDGSQSLQQFMTDVLKMKQTITSQKARQVCRFKHVQSLWLLLNLEKSQVLAAHKQDAFDNLGPDMKENLSDDQTDELVGFCRHQTLNKLEFVLQEIFDCVLLRIAQPRDQSDEDAMDFKGISLRDIIYGDIDSPLYAENPVETLVMEDMNRFPPDIKGSQAVSAWITVYKELDDKRKQAL